jgi:hypothetical protein
MSEIGDSIIDYYKKALEARNNDKKELIEDISNSIESLNVNETVLEKIDSDDPLENFLFKFTNILKENKQEDRVQLIEEFSEKVEETLQQDIKEEIEDPLEKFLFKINDIIVSDKNEIVKNTALNLIEQLKNKEEFIEEEVEIKDIPLPPQPELGEVPNVTPPLNVDKKIDKPLPEKRSKQNPNDVYVKELQNADKDLTKASEENELSKTIREEVGKQVKEILARYRNGVVSEGGGGDGNFSKEFRFGGTMDGSLNVTGQYLSGGVDLFTIFSTTTGGGGGSSDRLISGTESLILNPDGTLTFPSDTIRTSDGKMLSIESETSNLSAFTKIALSGNAFYAYDSNGNIITFDTIDNTITLTTLNSNDWKFTNNGKLIGPNNILEIEGNLNTSNKILSGGVDLADIFLTQETDSQTLSFTESSAELSISNGNNVSLSSLNDKPYIDQNFLPLSGGIITNNLTVQGNISALGTATFANTLFTTTSALSVYNTGPSPALYVYQSAGPYDVASFYDGDGIEVLHVGNAEPSGLGRVGINESFPNVELTVRGSISATDTICANSYLSGGVNLLDIFGNPTDRLINGSYQVVLSSNGDLTLPGAIVTASNSKLDFVGFGPNTAYLTTTPDDTTALFMGAVNAELRANSYVSIATNTGDITNLWEFSADGSLKFPDNTTQTTAFTGNPDSSKWDSTYTTVQSNSGNWQSTFTTVQGNSATFWQNSKTIATFTATQNQPPSASFATLDTRNSIAVLDFDDTAVESAIFLSIIPENTILTSGLAVYTTWTATSATTGNVRWRAEWMRCNTDLDSNSFDTAVETNGTANGTSGITTTTLLSTTNIDGLIAGNVFRLRISRVGNDGTNDTMSGDAELIAVEVRSVA